MSITKHNGTITLTTFAELGDVIDPHTLPDVPATPADGDRCPEASASQSITVFDLATLMAELASLSGGVETMAREDALAREQATIELARYEALLAERSDTEHALAVSA